jgi:hypothetical protein
MRVVAAETRCKKKPLTSTALRERSFGGFEEM